MSCQSGQPIADHEERVGYVEAWFTALRAGIRHGGDQACYSAAADLIRMPAVAAFQEAPAYYAILGHKCIH